MSGRLSIVATPIGCLEDITLRAIRVLREADLILAEDTRHTRTLCSTHDIETPLRSFHAHSSPRKVDGILESLSGGAHYALVSDAGTPLVSDPGADLVARARDAGVEVEAIPGPSAVLAALCVAGIRAPRFTFEGFVARSGRARKDALARIARSEAATVLFESPHRIHATLDDLEEVIGDERIVAVCRELTKIHEQVVRGTCAEVRRALAESPRGEVTVIVEGRASSASPDEVDVEALVAAWQAEGLGTTDMAKRLRDDYGWKRADAYQRVIELVGADD
jgi:16S rRNA (cytidine1402-2'-O)-methyltransferase